MLIWLPSWVRRSPHYLYAYLGEISSSIVLDSAVLFSIVQGVQNNGCDYLRNYGIAAVE